MNIELEKQDIGLFIVFMQISNGGVILFLIWENVCLLVKPQKG